MKAQQRKISYALQSVHAVTLWGIARWSRYPYWRKRRPLEYGRKAKTYFARAMLKSSPILILDEATASVDVETERKIQQALQHLIKDRTTLIIAHRLSTIREVDTIIFLENGKIMNKGATKS